MPQSDILIMDDSASALDYATDARHSKSNSGYEEKTDCIYRVTENFLASMNADMILVLDDGKIAGQGTHEQLLKSCEYLP